MEINEIITQLKDKFGDKINVDEIKTKLQGMGDHSKMSFEQIVANLKGHDLFGDLDGDGKKEGLVDELKGKASQIFGAFKK